jgi:hypothetical protein
MTDWGQAAGFGGEAPGFGASRGIGERGERGRAGYAAGRRLEETRRTARRSVVCGILGERDTVVLLRVEAGVVCVLVRGGCKLDCIPTRLIVVLNVPLHSTRYQRSNY